MIDASSFSNQEVKSAALLAIVVLWVLYLFVMRRFSIGFGILAIGLVLCSQYSQNPALPEHLSPCVGTAVVIGVSPGGIGLPTAIGKRCFGLVFVHCV
jgi:hypothetical protein